MFRVFLSFALVVAVSQADLKADADRVYKEWTEGRLVSVADNVEWFTDSLPPFPEYLSGFSALEHMCLYDIPKIIDITHFEWEILSVDEDSKTTVSEWKMDGKVKSTGKTTHWEGRQLWSWNDEIPSKIYRIETWSLDASKHIEALKSPGQVAVDGMIGGFIAQDLKKMAALTTKNFVFKWPGSSPVAGEYDLEGFVTMIGGEFEMDVHHHDILHESKDFVSVRFVFDELKYRRNGKELIGRQDVGITCGHKIKSGKIAEIDCIFDREPSAWRWALDKEAKSGKQDL